MIQVGGLDSRSGLYSVQEREWENNKMKNYC